MPGFEVEDLEDSEKPFIAIFGVDVPDPGSSLEGDIVQNTLFSSHNVTSVC